ncbi:MAG: hypothetical protein Q4C59_05635 [Lachnospiraceae bacterium]|nr:hypothetical protein [Lachnospiraceae bacterium]
MGLDSAFWFLWKGLIFGVAYIIILSKKRKDGETGNIIVRSLAEQEEKYGFGTI